MVSGEHPPVFSAAVDMRDLLRMMHVLCTGVLPGIRRPVYGRLPVNHMPGFCPEKKGVRMIYIVLGLIGAVMGSVYLYGRGDFLLGGVIGLLVAAVINQRNALLAMGKRLDAIESRITGLAGQPVDDKDPSGRTPSPGQTETAGSPIETIAPAAADPFPGRATPAPAAPATADMPSLDLELADTALDDIEAPAAPTPADRPKQPPGGSFDAIRDFLIGGNLMVRVGLVILLFGFAFLVKYAAARNLVPLEIRLAAAFAAGVGLLVLGWRLRARRFGYAVALQGGGVGVMYLTLFAAARLFHMVPLPLTFVVMVGLVVFSGILAVLQNAASMAVLGAAGGFMAPVLLSTGTGSHVMLFAYYALLNAGIFGIAWFKAWRWLNLVGFGFTFGIGSAWGLKYYQPHHLATTEPFLVLFFVFYLAIAVLFALRQPPRLKGYVDGTLVFGMPLVVFSLQVGLVKDIEYGLAFSALAMGLVYTGLATALWRRRDDGLGALVEAFLALGVVFGSLAIPLALSGSWTAVAWSIEGAGLVWVGLRQHRLLARSFGLLLQVGSGAMFVLGGHGAWDNTLLFNSRLLGGMMLGATGLFSAFFLERHRQRLRRWERPLSAVSMAWGLLWWFGTGLAEIDRRMSRRHELSASLAYIGVSALVMGLLYRRLNWKGLRWPALGLLPVMIMAAVALFDRYGTTHPFQGWWLLLWPSLGAIHLYLLRTLDRAWHETIGLVWHVAGALLASTLLAWEAGWLLDRLAGGAPVWAFIAWGLVPSAVMVALIRLRDQQLWPLVAWPPAYRGWLPVLLAAWLLAWTLVGTSMNGDPSPLPFLPLLNPLDLVQSIVFLVLAGWVLWMRAAPSPPAEGMPAAVLWGAPAAGVFVWLTAVVARCVHHLGGVPYHGDAMFGSGLFHAAVAVLWGLLALVCMVAANRFRHRTVWFAGAGLLAVVVIKLFVVDLSDSGTVSRIVSFLAVGGLMLVVGFFTPLPPAESKGTDS
jgi:uncharacterized membrane protein